MKNDRDAETTPIGTARPRPDARGRLALLIAPALLVGGVLSSGSGRAGAMQETPEQPAMFLKFGKNYINIQKVSRILDDPGGNLPPGSITIFFSSGAQDWVTLFGDEAEKFRQTIAPMTADLTPKAEDTAKKTVKVRGAADAARKALAPRVLTPVVPAGPTVAAPQPDPGGI